MGRRNEKLKLYINNTNLDVNELLIVTIFKQDVEQKYIFFGEDRNEKRLID